MKDCLGDLTRYEFVLVSIWAFIISVRFTLWVIISLSYFIVFAQDNPFQAFVLMVSLYLIYWTPRVLPERWLENEQR